MPATSEKIAFPGSQGQLLAARLDRPAGKPKAAAILAHCFACSKNSLAASRIAHALAARGFAVLRFDFTGLGASGGEVGNADFASNVRDLLAAADYLRREGLAPGLLIGHSLGGAAVLAAAPDIPEAKAVATIGAPADAAEVIRHFAAHPDGTGTGEADVALARERFPVERPFLDDLEAARLHARIADMRKALLIFHAPLDDVVGIDNAAKIFEAARHPKSFISLDGADHVLTRQEDAGFVADMLAAWASRYLGAEQAPEHAAPDEGVISITETGRGKFQQAIQAGPHHLIADEPASMGGDATGPTPYDYLAIGLGACTAMTLRLYAGRKKLPLDHVEVLVTHEKRHIADCEDCPKSETARIDQFERTLRLTGSLTEAQRAELVAIADRCPVHRTLAAGARIVTKAEPQQPPK